MLKKIFEKIKGFQKIIKEILQKLDIFLIISNKMFTFTTLSLILTSHKKIWYSWVDQFTLN